MRSINDLTSYNARSAKFDVIMSNSLIIEVTRSAYISTYHNCLVNQDSLGYFDIFHLL